ncbi:terminase large subunit [Nesterenkonia jeotgali]
MAVESPLTEFSLDDLPVPYEALVELGLEHVDIVEAAKRRPRDVAFQADQHPDAWFDVELARKKLAVIGRFKHTKGRWAGVPMKLGEGLDSWQIVWVLAPVFGWVYYDAEAERVVRVIRTVWVEIPRKNGKSTLSSAISGLLLLADGEAGAEVYNAAGSSSQAARVFDEAKAMMMASPSVRKRIEPLKAVVRAPKTLSVLRVLSKVAETAHGLNVSGGVIDEIHTLRHQRKLVEAIETGTGARDQPLILFITTADEAEEGTIYDEKHTFTLNCAKRVVDDPSHYGVIWGASESDDIFSDVTLAKANPGHGKSPSWKYLRGEAKKAQASPTYLVAYKQLALNMRSRNASRWIDLDRWDTLTGAKRSALRGRRAWGGLDLSAVADFSAWSVWAESNRPGRQLELFTRLWVPEAAVDKLAKQLQIPLHDWIERGYVSTTEGEAIHYDAIQQAVIGDCKHFDMQRVSYDRMFAGQMVQNLDEKLKGIEVATVAQTFMGLGPAMKEMERLMLTKTMRHDGNPAMRWMAGVVEVKKDDLDNVRPIKPDRRKSSSRIDGVQAAITGLDGVVRMDLHEAPNWVYTGTSTRRG